jgi:hypothetical protein
MKNTAKIRVLSKPEKVGNARLLKIESQGDFYIPETCFFGYNPYLDEAEVETWILDQKGIKYKV